MKPGRGGAYFSISNLQGRFFGQCVATGLWRRTVGILAGFFFGKPNGLCPDKHFVSNGYENITDKLLDFLGVAGQIYVYIDVFVFATSRFFNGCFGRGRLRSDFLCAAALFFGKNNGFFVFELTGMLNKAHTRADGENYTEHEKGHYFLYKKTHTANIYAANN